MPSSRDLVLSLNCLESVVKADLMDLDGAHVASCVAPRELLTKLRHDLRSLQTGSSSAKDIESYGRSLAEVACLGDLREALLQAVTQSQVRLRLRITDELSDIPWEFLYVPETAIGFVSQSPGIRLSRLAGDPRTIASPKEAITVLLVYADPQSPKYPALAGLEDELNSIRDLLVGQQYSRIKIDVLRHATPNSLHRQLESNRYDVFHFLGHADHRPSGGLIVLEGHMPREHSEIYGEDIAPLLIKAGVKVVFLSGCESNGHATSIGGHLTQASIPAVLGMQLPVADVDALLFARTFYAALSSGATLEEATYQGRMAIRGSGLDWAAPVLATAQPDMKLVSVDQTEARPMRGNLPKPITSFIGRAKEIADVCDALVNERLVILLGSGGIGKTRLSIEIGRQCAPRFANGVWQVLLENVNDGDKVIEAIARVFGIRDSSEKSIEDRLFEFLTTQELLLILDNCEHVVGACRDAASRILSDCPGVRILATSREVLGTGADYVVRVPSLSYPMVPKEDVPVYPVNETIAQYEALQLLCARAKAANSQFVANERNIEPLCRIAQRLDGIPLALELAASRMRAYSADQVLDRLIKDLSWLDVKNPGKVPRHQTLRATLDWSYRLLTEPEQRAFNRLAVFGGTFSLEAAEAVAVGGPVSAEEFAEIFSNLVDKSLVVAEEDEHGTRYRLLETCKAYAKEGLTKASEVHSTMTRFFDYCVGLATRLYELEVSLDLVRWQTAAKPEHENFVAAIEWALTEGHQPALAGTIVVKLVDYWLMIGFVRQTAHLIERILHQLSEDEVELQVRLNVLGGTIAIYGGDSWGLERIKAAHALAVASNDGNLIRYAAARLGECAYEQGDEATAIEMFAWVIRHCEEIGEPKMEGYARLFLGNIDISRQAYEEAADHLARMITDREKLGDFRGVGVAQCTLAHCEYQRGNAYYAYLFRTGLDHLASLNDVHWLSGFVTLASARFIKEQPTLAASIQGFAERIGEESGMNQDLHVKRWIGAVIDSTRQALGDSYLYWFNHGRTSTLSEILDLLAEPFAA